VGGVILSTERLRLVPAKRDEVLAGIENLPPAHRAEVSPEWLARARAASSVDPWLFGFSATDQNTGAVVGGCGIKGPPDSEGVVEITYGVDPAHQKCGYATEAAQALIAFAFGSGLVRVVRAHTRARNVASERVLAKCGFERLGEVIDPEDGQVWRWERTKEGPGQTSG
jgi:RimJ/RimL family protein N-acetyltransferase